MNKPNPENTESKIVLLMGGDIDQEGITTKITSIGHLYKKRNLNSSTNNWLSIASQINDLRQNDQLVAVFLKLTQDIIETIATKKEYQDAWNHIYDSLKQVKSIIFIYEPNLLGEFTNIPEGDEVTTSSKQLDFFQLIVMNILMHYLTQP